MASNQSVRVDVSTATVVRIGLTILALVLLVTLIGELRGPLIWVLIAAMIATALNAPVVRLSARMPRPLAITIVYLGLVLAPIGLLSLAIPPLINEAGKLIRQLPSLLDQAQVQLVKNEQLSGLLESFDPLETLKNEAANISRGVGDVAGFIAQLGLGAANSVVATFTIVILSIFFVAGGSGWMRTLIDGYSADRAPLLHHLLDRVGTAIAAYFAGTLLIAFIAGVTSYIVMSILGIPYATALAVTCGVASLIPMFGATIAAIFVGLIAALTTTWSVVLIWAIWQLIYQQLENNLVQPQVQKRTVKVPPVLTVIGVLFGSSLLGVLGAVIAIPLLAAMIAIAEETSAWRRGAAAVQGGPAFAAATRADAAVDQIDVDRG